MITHHSLHHPQSLPHSIGRVVSEISEYKGLNEGYVRAVLIMLAVTILLEEILSISHLD